MRTTCLQNQSVRAAVIAAIALGVVLIIAVLSMEVGAITLTIGQVIDGFSGGKNAFIVSQYRAPRIAVSILAGTSFGLSGAFLQAALRNPLASPDVVGITKCGALGAFLVALSAPPASAFWSIPLGVVAGAAVGASALLALGHRLGGGVTAFALAGIAIGMFAHGLMQYAMVLFPTRADQSTIWLAGSVYGSSGTKVAALAIWLLACMPLVFVSYLHFDAGGFANDTLTSLGMSPGRLRGGLILVSVLLCAGAVAAVGSIGFLGLLAPHAARLLVGSRARRLVPLSALIGALTLTAADLVGRVVALPNEIPAGIVSALIGGPYLIFLLVKEARHHD